MAQVLTTDLSQMDGAEIADISSAQSVRRRYQLPEVVASGKAGTQINTLELLNFSNTGSGWCELFSFENQRVQFLIPPYTKVVIRPIFAGVSGSPEWQYASNKETIIAASEQAHQANLTTTAVTAAAAALNLSTADTYAEATVEAAWDTDIDAVIAGVETDFDASAAESEVYIAAILDKLEALNITAAA